MSDLASEDARGPVWVCDSCGYRTADRFTITMTRGGSSHCCDSCGGELVCSECYDHPEFCDCTTTTSGGPNHSADAS